MVRKIKVIRHKRKIPTKKRPVTVINHEREIPKSVRKAIVNDYLQELRTDLKKKGRVAIKDVGVMRLQRMKAKKGGKKMYSHLLKREIITKPKPACKRVKFRASKSLKDIL